MRRAGVTIALLCAAIARAGAQTDTSEFLPRPVSINGGLGVTLINASDIVDYINLTYQPSSKLDDFSVAAEFFGAGEVRVSDSWGVKLEYSYLLKSYTVPQQFGADYTFSYGIHMPVAMAQYIVAGRGYAFKFGGGAGYHIANFTQEASVFVSDTYTSKGVGIKLEAEGNTEFDEHLYGLISVDARDAIMGEFKSQGNQKLVIPVTNKNAGMNFFSLGLKFGLVYYL
jgi:hypothetical protein